MFYLCMAKVNKLLFTYLLGVWDEEVRFRPSYPKTRNVVMRWDAGNFDGIFPQGELMNVRNLHVTQLDIEEESWREFLQNQPRIRIPN